MSRFSPSLFWLVTAKRRKKTPITPPWPRSHSQIQITIPRHVVNLVISRVLYRPFSHFASSHSPKRRPRAQAGLTRMSLRPRFLRSPGKSSAKSATWWSLRTMTKATLAAMRMSAWATSTSARKIGAPSFTACYERKIAAARRFSLLIFCWVESLWMWSMVNSPIQRYVTEWICFCTNLTVKWFI